MLKKKSGKIKVVAAVLAGGSGSRMKSIKTLKQFLYIGKKTVIQKSIQAFKDSGVVDKVIVTLPKKLFKEYEAELKKYRFGSFIETIEGGKERQISSYNVLRHVKASGGAEIILIHDAVRPFIDKELIQKSILLAKKYGACEVAVPAIDTLMESDGIFIKQMLKREKIYYAQTPQTFKFSLILEAHEKAMKEGLLSATDDAGLIMKQGGKVAILEGSYDNIKITTPKDYELAKIIDHKRS